MPKPKLKLTSRLKQALMADDNASWHSLTTQQVSDILDEMLTLMATAAGEGDTVTIQRLGATTGLLLDRLRALRSSPDAKPPVTTHADAQERIGLTVARLTAFLDPSAVPAPQDVVSDDADNTSIPAEHNESA